MRQSGRGSSMHQFLRTRRGAPSGCMRMLRQEAECADLHSVTTQIHVQTIKGLAVLKVKHTTHCWLRQSVHTNIL